MSGEPTDDEMRQEWRALVDFAAHDPAHWTSRRWDLAGLGDPPVDFLRRFFTALNEPRPVALVAREVDGLLTLERLRQSRERIAAVAAPTQDAAPQPGPQPIASLAEVEHARAELEAANLPHGYGSIAKHLGVSKATVRRRLAGD